MSELTAETYPLMPLRDIVLFPGMVAPLVVGKKENRSWRWKLLWKAVPSFFWSPRRMPGLMILNRVICIPSGTLASVMQLLRLPDGTIKALVEGKRRALIVGGFKAGDARNRFIRSGWSKRRMSISNGRMCRPIFVNYAKTFDQYSPGQQETAARGAEIHHLSGGSIADGRSHDLAYFSEDRGETIGPGVGFSLPQRIGRVLEILHREMELSEMEKDIHAKVKKRMGSTQRNYYLSEKMRVIQDEMGSGEGGDELSELQQAIEKKICPKR
jgi:ATP-dependent Lon protease